MEWKKEGKGRCSLLQEIEDSLVTLHIGLKED
jgi:hypothetical protein